MSGGDSGVVPRLSRCYSCAPAPRAPATGISYDMGMTRRDLLAGSLSAGLLALLRGDPARALGPQQQVTALRIRHQGSWDINPGALECLLEEMRLRTSTDTAERELVVDVAEPALHDSLFGVILGVGGFSFSDAERQRLSRWMGLGGLLVFDNAGRTAPDKAFDTSARAELKKMLPQAVIERVSPEHVIFRSFYRLDYPAGRAIFQSYVEAVRLGSRYCAILSSNDLFGALARGPDRQFLEAPTPGGESQREMAVRFAVNLLMYAACLHYKDDQVHIDYLLHKRKWKVRPPE